MNWLPYSGGSAGGWFTAFGGSAVAHGGFVALALWVGSASGEVQTEVEVDPGFVVSFEPIDTALLQSALAEEVELAAAAIEEVEVPPPDDLPPVEEFEEEGRPEEPEIEEVEPVEEEEEIEPVAEEEEIEPVEEEEQIEEVVAEEIDPEELPVEEVTAETEEIDEVTPEETPIEEAEIEEIEAEEIVAEELPVEEIGAEAAPPLETAEVFEPDADSLDPDLPPGETIAGIVAETETIAGVEAGGDLIAGVDAGTADLAPVGTADIAPTPLAPVAPLEPVISDATPFGAEPETLNPLVGDGAGTADVLAPVGPAGDTIALAPVGPAGGGVGGGGLITIPPVGADPGAGSPIVIAPDVPETVAAAGAEEQAPDPTPEPAVEAPPPNPQDVALADLILRIRDAGPSECLIALPRRAGTEAVGLFLVADSPERVAAFEAEVLSGDADADILRATTIVDPRQCPALDFIGQTRDYPATGMGVQIDTPEVVSGESLTGTLRGGAGQFKTVLLIDDNGVVQDLQRFLTVSGLETTFDVPVTLASESRATQQLVLAIAASVPPRAITDSAGLTALEVFTALDPAFVEDVSIAVGTFDITLPPEAAE